MLHQRQGTRTHEFSLKLMAMNQLKHTSFLLSSLCKTWDNQVEETPTCTSSQNESAKRVGKNGARSNYWRFRSCQQRQRVFAGQNLYPGQLHSRSLVSYILAALVSLLVTPDLLWYTGKTPGGFPSLRDRLRSIKLNSNLTVKRIISHTHTHTHTHTRTHAHISTIYLRKCIFCNHALSRIIPDEERMGRSFPLMMTSSVNFSN